MKVLFIGGTGTISAEISKLAAARGVELCLLNRGNRKGLLEGTEGINYISGDIDDPAAQEKLKNGRFDAVVDFIVFTPEQAKRDIRLFEGATKQYVFISSASAYQKPLSNSPITESAPLRNPYWQYSRDKIACEDVLTEAYRKTGFPITIVRPSHTYGVRSLPLAVHGKNGPWSVIKRIMDGKPVIVHGDGTSLWTVTHSRDFAKGFLPLIGNIRALGEAVHITGDEALTWDQIYRCIGAALGKEPEIRHVASDFLARFDPELRGALLGDKSHNAVFDNAKIKRLAPGFAATTSFGEGARESVKYFLETAEAQREDPEFDAWTDNVIRAHG